MPIGRFRKYQNIPELNRIQPSLSMTLNNLSFYLGYLLLSVNIFYDFLSVLLLFVLIFIFLINIQLLLKLVLTIYWRRVLYWCPHPALFTFFFLLPFRIRTKLCLLSLLSSWGHSFLFCSYFIFNLISCFIFLFGVTLFQTKNWPYDKGFFFLSEYSGSFFPLKIICFE